MKLLLIEDNKPLADSLKKQLGKTFIIDAVRSGEEGMQQAISGSYDIIVLDLGLPDKNGHDVCRGIRANGISIPILVLTGVDDISSRVALLDDGADDYLTKPFNVAELRARLGALLRRPTNTYTSSVLTVRDLTLDPTRRSVQRGGVPIALRRKEFDILEYLVRNQGRPVTRAMILDHAWDGSKDAWNNTVDVHIKHLRDKIDRPFDSTLIQTAYGIGYMVEAANATKEKGGSYYE
ncbi:MAG TPA: response regulator transcription factor [Candidatus Saccharimonadales bacterium]|nr:response regulator transcription factor [Candidatus Saccharimonadales bacterium]